MSKKLLIVDDEPHIRLLLEQTLEDLEEQEVEILTATNGVEALETIQREKPNLMFLDVMMPKMNGYDVCEKVKGDPSLSDLYIIMLTAKGQEFDRSRGKDVGADIYMTKPFDPDEILEKACKILGIGT